MTYSSVKQIILVILTLLVPSCTSVPVHRNPSSLPPISDLTSLASAFKSAADGDVIRVAENSEFDLTGLPSLVIDKRITLKSEAKPGSGNQPRFFSKHKPLPLLRIKASGVVLDGLFIEGFERDSKKKEIIELNRKGIKGVYQFPVTRGIDIEAANTTIKNCEIAGFSHAAIFMLEGSSAVIESNSIHHNQRWGLGYGVALHQRSTALIKGNRFDYNRHSIAGSGFSGQSYEAEANEFGVHHSDSPLDMHGGKDRSDGTSIAGKRVEIHHNVVLYSGQPVFIHRGIAEDFVSIHDNEIHHPKPDQAIGYFNGVTRANLPAGKFRYYKNRFK